MIGTEHLDRLVHDELAMGEDVAAVGNRERKLNVLFHQQHAAATLPGVLAYDGEKTLDDDRCEAERHLVEKKKTGLAGEGPSEREHLLLAARQQTGTAIEQLGQLGEVIQGGVSIELLTAVPETEVLGDRQAEEDTPALGHVRDSQLGSSGW